MENQGIKTFNKKLVAIILIIAIFLQQLVIPISVVHAESSTEELIVVRIDDSEDAQLDYEDYGLVHVVLELRGNYNYSGLDVSIGYDTSVMKPTFNAGTARRPSYMEATDMTDWDIVDSRVWSSTTASNNTWLFPDESRFRIVATTSPDKNPSTSGGAITVADLYFMAEPGYDLTNIPATAMYAAPDSIHPTGIKLVRDTYYLIEPGLSSDGFVQSEKTLDSISIKTNPTKTSYIWGDTIELAGGELTLNYDDGSSEDISMTTAGVSIATGSPAITANPNVTVSYNGKTASFPITVTDPVTSLAVTTPMSVVEYNHDDPLNFSGLQLTATKKSGATVTVTSTTPGST